MLKREIKYEDFDGNEAVDVFYFNISKPELIELEVEHQEGFTKWIERVIEAKDHKTLMEQFKKIVLLAYGQKSEDGKRFIKNEQIREEFSQTAAYISLFTELAMDDNKAAEFLLSVLPKDMVEASKDAATPAPTSS